MSNLRKTRAGARYRSEFLHSPAWLARRARWFRKHDQLGRPLMCMACGRSASAGELELHHLDYAGVRSDGGVWRAFERHDDLVPLHPYCHGVLHQMIEHDRVLAFHRSRRVASSIALRHLRARFMGQGQL